MESQTGHGIPNTVQGGGAPPVFGMWTKCRDGSRPFSLTVLSATPKAATGASHTGRAVRVHKATSIQPRWVLTVVLAQGREHRVPPEQAGWQVVLVGPEVCWRATWPPQSSHGGKRARAVTPRWSGCAPPHRLHMLMGGAYGVWAEGYGWEQALVHTRVAQQQVCPSKLHIRAKVQRPATLTGTRLPCECVPRQLGPPQTWSMGSIMQFAHF
jgi:hypothetical protein